jgi:hypothetical protein
MRGIPLLAEDRLISEGVELVELISVLVMKPFVL